MAESEQAGTPTPEPERGIACPKCASRLSRVWYTRPIPGGVRRSRECVHCGRRYTTTEQTFAERTRRA